MITIIDLGIGNLGSLKNMFDHLDVSCEIKNDNSSIMKATKIVLSGVGSFDSAMKKINYNKELKNILNDLVLTKKIPVLGICLGMQIMLEGSEEGKEAGLSWVKGSVKKFNKDLNIKVPHMGWNIVEITKKNFLSDAQQKYYFVHSYYVDLKNKNDCIMKTNYGIEFVSGISTNNIYGVQFHPEKSHKNGMQILKNFSLI
jgi:glutamine amidotransferase